MKLTFLGTGPTGQVFGKGKNRRTNSSALTHGHKDASNGLVGPLKKWMKKVGQEKVTVMMEDKTLKRLFRDYKNLKHLDIYLIKPKKSFKFAKLKITRRVPSIPSAEEFRVQNRAGL